MISFPTPWWLNGFAILCLAALSTCGQSTTNRLFAGRAEHAFLQAQADWTRHPDDAKIICDLGRTTYDWAEFATNAEQRATIARVGIAACKHLVELDPHSAWGHYYLGMDDGELAAAEAPSLAAYKLIWDLEREFKAAADSDAHVDHAGPLRCLGLLYRDAPGWPVSIGSRSKAKEYLDQAAAMDPDFPENQMNLVESNVKWHQAADAELAWRRLQALWPVARTNLAGLAWEVDWSDWTYRREVVKGDFHKAFKRNLEPAN